MNIEPMRVYPREVICGECGVAICLSWYNPMNLSQGGEAVYEHPDRAGCEFRGKRMRATALVCSVTKEEWEE